MTMFAVSPSWRYSRLFQRLCSSRLKRLTVFGCVACVCFLLVLMSRDTVDRRTERYLKYTETEDQRQGPGEGGKGVQLLDLDNKHKDINEKEGFNFAASEMVSLDRSLKDLRSKACKKRIYPVNLPKASVIIVYHNEASSVVLRTVHSVVNRSPPAYLREVMLVDDASTRPDLKEPLRQHIAETWPDGEVRLVTIPQRSGLIQAKLYGAQRARGDVLIFLDAHCEASKGWIEPILNEIHEDPTRVICPVIDSIDKDDLAYQFITGTPQRGGFWWSMHFSWESIPLAQRLPEDQAFRSPTMAGGLFAADKTFFFHIGAYDDKMEIWGGENLDLSFRAWMCGGSLLFHPCSHVGHIFRPSHPYGFPDKTRDYHGINSKRVAEVWMDGFKRYYYFYRPDIQDLDVGDLSDRHEVRQKAQCHDFEWYLDEVYPGKLKLDVNVRAFGNVRNPTSGLCLDVLNHDETATYTLVVNICHNFGVMSQTFSFMPDSLLRREGTCLFYPDQEPGKPVVMSTECMMSSEDKFKWSHDQVSGEIRHDVTGYCLDAENLGPEDLLVARKCNQKDTQTWKWEHYYDL